jgi:hypothetical protein
MDFILNDAYAIAVSGQIDYSIMRVKRSRRLMSKNER